MESMFITHGCTKVVDSALPWAKLMHNRQVGWKAVNRKTGEYERARAPPQEVEVVAEFYHINMKDFDPSDIHEYKTFENLFGQPRPRLACYIRGER